MAAESREEKSRNMISSPGFCYSGLSSTSPNLQTHHLVNQIQGFEPSPELFNLTTGMDMLGFPSKNLQQREVNSGTWKGFFGKSIDLQGPSTSKTINEHESDFYQPDFSETTNDNLIVTPDMAWQESRLAVDDSSLRSVFPGCDGNDRPTRGLSLSLASNQPSSIGIQSFELKVTSHRHQHQHQHEQDDDIRFISSNSRDGFFGKFANIQQQQILQDGILGKAGDNLHQSNFEIKNSKYLAPAQELLNEFCGLGRKQTDSPKQKPRKSNNLEEHQNGCGSSSRNQSLYPADLLELPKRKAKLLSMLEEVDRRYRHYCDQMKAVVSSFEMVAGNGAAKVYSTLASKAMSRHFRCLRDGIVGQIRATKKAMGEKDPVAPGTTKGETPRLRLLDQTLRQQKALQQMNVLESHPWRPQRGLPERSVSVLRAWLFEHFLHPYPSDVDKHVLARQTGLSRSQVSNWFINARVRLWKPMVEEMYMEETKEQEDNMVSSDGIPGLGDQLSPELQTPNLNSRRRHEDHKPTADQLARIDSECLSSIINNQENNDIKNDGNHQNRHHHPHHQHQQQEQQLAPQHQQFGRVGNSFGVIDLDFSSYNPHTASTVSYSNGGAHQNFGNGVSLTLGLQQHGTSGVSLAFSPSSHHHSLIFPRDHIEDCQPVHQYSILEGEGQNLPYRNLMGVQLLHDFAG